MTRASKSALRRFPAIAMIVLTACTAQAADRATLLAAIHEACGADKERLCSDAKPGETGRCFKEHWNEVSPVCRDVITSAREALRRPVYLPPKMI